jgi:hypothetical protein
MKAIIRTSLMALAMAGASSAATLSLVTNTNPEEVTGGEGVNQTEFTSEILSGQTLFIGIPYAAGAWGSAEATDYFEVRAFLLASGGTSTASFDFYTATDTGTALTDIAVFNNGNTITTGVANVAQAVSGTPSDPGNTNLAGVTVQLEYGDSTGNPFGSLSAGIVWLGITNSGSNTIVYYTGVPGGFGSPNPEYSFGGPFDSGATSLAEDTYVYSSNVSPNDTLETANQNVHPYINITAETVTPVPEPGAIGLVSLGGILLIRRRRCA